MKDRVWRDMLTAEFNVEYLDQISRKFSRRERNIKIFLACTSSATVAGWSIWTPHPWVWQGLSAISAIIAVASPILDHKGLQERIRRTRTGWHELVFAYRALWPDLDSEAHDEHLHYRIEELERRFIKVSEEDIALPRDEQLMRVAQKQVLHRRGYQ
jgi:hypothetical protein